MSVLVINGKTIKAQKGQTAKIKINKNDQVELLDDNGNPAQSLTMQESGEDLIIYGENGQPEFVLVQYQNAPELAALVPPAGETVATSEAVLASQTGISKSTMVLGGLLALAAGGVAAGAGGGGGSSDGPAIDPNNPDNHLPSLTLGKSEVSIKENQKGEIITTVKADDADGDQVSYSVNDSRFEIDSKGNLKLKAGNALDFEKEKTINLTITAKDAKGGTTTQNL
ncbi:MAG: cadherin repeat domain-containing protein, partial [Neisseriaceae bacterium]|nr:cadherin repeat domain-containing protein [Neisseriaceae bacterium]